MKYLALLLLTGCAFSIQKLPDPTDPKVASILAEHGKVLEVLVAEYNKNHPVTKEEVKPN